MTAAESFETIMARNNTTTVPAARRTGHADARKPTTTFLGLGNASVTKNVAAVTLIVCFCLMLSSASAATIKKRAVVDTSSVLDNNTNSSALAKVCQNTPCGWAIYIPFTRRIDYFMKNTCDCSSENACLKSDDDLSVNAYVYRCKPRPPTTTTTTIRSPSLEK